MRPDQSRFDNAFAADLQRVNLTTPVSVNGASLPVVPRPVELSTTAFRNALSHYASGVTVITSTDQHGPIGFTCQSFYSVSTEPPLISFSVQKSSTTYPKIRATGSFAVNVLTRHQQHVSNQFSRSGTDKWNNLGWSSTQAGNPVLDEAMMWLDCQIWAEHDAGDHMIVLGKVEAIGFPKNRSDDPLIYFKGSYRYLSAE